MAKVTINPGVCGLITEVETKAEGSKVLIKITTKCGNIKKVADELKEVEAYDEIFKKIIETKTYTIASKHVPHVTCPVASGILKAVEVEAGLALPKDVEIKIEK